MPDRIRRFSIVVPLALAFMAVSTATIAYASTAEEIQAQIDAQNAQIQQLKNEIAQIQTDLTTVGNQKKTLVSAVQEITLNIQKLQKTITLTETQIKQKDLEISRLSGNIATTSQSIGTSQSEIAGTLRSLAETDTQPLMIVYLSGGTLSSFFDETTSLSAVRNNLQTRVHELSELKNDLEVSKDTAEGKRKELASLKANLNTQKQGLAAARDSQNKLLAETKNKESTYQTLLAQKKAQEEKFENDLASLESQLKQTVDPGSFAQARSGVLMWPLDKVRITQYFGNTDFSTANPQIYNGRGHNAIDLAASDGTPVKAALGGVVMGTGNTDLQAGCYSYGKWVLIQHPNGLSTLYAHLSVINVSKGGSVSGGQVIGLSGRTGYATGPHLHFGVYATQGVQIVQFTRSVNCKNTSIPIADPTAYLNPLSYLPKI
ncbi:MAG: peptidoglycan DD-metalloendopeptidase family protein [Patescibacteria group bacterium]